MAAEMFYDDDADLSVLDDKTIAIIGYGSQGSAQSQCLRDSGLDVIIAELEGSPNYERAVADGWDVQDTETAAGQADLIQILTQDHVQPKVYEGYVEPKLEEGNGLIFSHGFNIRYGSIVPPEFVDVFMIAPKGPGALVRECYVDDIGVPSLVAVEQDATGNALDYALAYAKALKATKAGVIKTSFTEETETDLFGEQAVLCGGVTAMITTAFEVLVEAGYQPEIAYFEVCHELKLIMDLIYERGIQGMRDNVSDTATYGDLTRGPRVITEDTKQEMKKMLAEVQSGEFAREWTMENMTYRMVFNSLQDAGREHQIEEVGARLRKMMPFLPDE